MEKRVVILKDGRNRPLQTLIVEKEEKGMFFGLPGKIINKASLGWISVAVEDGLQVWSVARFYLSECTSLMEELL